jgi:glycerol-3-phosphate dehydrogenase
MDGERFDAVVIGGGVYGILLALEGAARGQRVLLLERDDFGGGATFNHLRTVHGGLRYLQFLDLRRAVTSNRQRLWWLQHFPDLIEPIPCLMPLYGGGMRRPEAFHAAFLMARALGLDRDGAGGTRPMRVVPTAEVEQRLPHCRRDGLDRGALWHDAFMPRPHRVIAELLHWAEHAGAVLRNRAEFLSAEQEGNRSWRTTISDRKSGATIQVVARWLINASAAATDEVIARMVGPKIGPKIGKTGGRNGAPVLVPTLAWGLLLDRPPVGACSVAAAPPGEGRRTYFLHPYHGRVLAGTGHAGIPEGVPVPDWPSDDQLDGTLADLNEAMPGANFGRDQVQHVFRGVLPGVRPGSEDLLMHAKVIDHGKRDNAAGAWTVLGVKFTEAPFIARRLWDRLTGAGPKAMPPRPAPVSVPTIEVAQQMSDAELGASLQALARVEWQAGTEDLVWRRTDLWMDRAQAQRVARIMAGPRGLPGRQHEIL